MKIPAESANHNVPAGVDACASESFFEEVVIGTACFAFAKCCTGQVSGVVAHHCSSCQKKAKSP